MTLYLCTIYADATHHDELLYSNCNRKSCGGVYRSAEI